MYIFAQPHSFPLTYSHAPHSWTLKHFRYNPGLFNFFRCLSLDTLKSKAKTHPKTQPLFEFLISILTQPPNKHNPIIFCKIFFGKIWAYLQPLILILRNLQGFSDQDHYSIFYQLWITCLNYVDNLWKSPYFCIK